MLFLLKRRTSSSLIALVVLGLSGLMLRHVLGTGPEIGFSTNSLLWGLVLLLLVLSSDVLLHGLFVRIIGEPYRRRQRELALVFQGQSLTAMLAGAMLAGIGEELLFRGQGTSPFYLIGAALVFGLLHHIRASLWLFTLWAIWQGLLLAAGLWCTGELAVTMEAHFLHDLIGFLIFRYLNHQPQRIGRSSGAPEPS